VRKLNLQNLKPWEKGQSGNLAGRPKGIPNRKEILDYFLFEADINDMGVINNPPEWFDKVKPKKMYEVMTIAMGTKAMSGDEKAFNALNKALGEQVDITTGGETINAETDIKRKKIFTSFLKKQASE